MLAGYALSLTSLAPFDRETVFDTECLHILTYGKFSVTLAKRTFARICVICADCLCVVVSVTIRVELAETLLPKVLSGALYNVQSTIVLSVYYLFCLFIIYSLFIRWHCVYDFKLFQVNMLLYPSIEINHLSDHDHDINK